MTGPLAFDAAIGRLERALRFGIHPSLDGIRALTGVLGSPQDSFRSAQVTGTNGKTSVVRMLGALLHAHGHRTGVYTSPHLVSYLERVAVDGAPVGEEALALALSTAFGAQDDIALAQAETLGVGVGDVDAAFTEFEIVTAAALWLFREAGVGWACLEVGMGGRWDATSVVRPSVSVVTGVDLDHTERLGTTREEIARDKAYVIKPGSIAVLGPGCAGVEHVLLERTLAVGAPVVRVGEAEDDVTWRITGAPDRPSGLLWLDVCGALERYDGLSLTAPSYQAPNVATAIGAAEAALGGPLHPERTRAALAALTFPGRFELLRAHPPLVIDGAHNLAATRILASAVAEAFPEAPPTIVIGVLADKDARGMVASLAPVASGFVCTAPASERALPAAELAAIVHDVTGRVPETAPTVADALAAVADRPAVVTGSLYTAGEARRLVLG